MSRDALRARLVHGAGNVLYRDGIAATSTAALSKELGISKRTMYELFDSKDALVTAALAARDAPLRAAFIDAAEAAGADPAEQLVGLLAGVERFTRAPAFRGCPFLNASAELADPGHAAHAVCRAHKEALRAWIEARAEEAGARSPRALSEQLLALVDGALAQAVVLPPEPGVLPAAARALVAAARAGR